MSNEQRAWERLIGAGMSAAGAAGLLGNLYAESGLRPDNLQNTFEKKLGFTDTEYTAAVDGGSYDNFVHDSAGYGLAQWTYWSRKQALLSFARAAGKSIGDLDMQIDFLLKELSEGYKGLFAALKTAADVKTASDRVLTEYERPADMGDAVKARRAAYGQTYFEKFAGSKITEKEEKTVGKMKAEAFVAKLKAAAYNYKTLYVMGCFGAPMTAANKKRYTTNHAYNKQAARVKMINAASADTFGFDCVCLIKGILWGWNGNPNDSYGGAEYAVNGVPDIGVDTMINVCSGVSSDFSKIAVGEAVWLEGHIGVYIGGGFAVECTPAWKNGVQITAVANIGAKSGYASRRWTKHGKLPYIEYGAAEQTAPAKQDDTKPASGGGALSVGDIVNFTGSTHYTSANAATGVPCKAGAAKITQIYAQGKHAYHLIAVKGGTSNVYGWVDRADIASSGGEIKVGSVVRLKEGATTYAGGSLASFVYKRDHVVKQIDGKRVVITYGGIVVAAVNADDLTLA